MERFWYDESPFYTGKYCIYFKSSPEMNIKGGSFAVFEARLFGLSYVNFCKMCRDIYNAEIRGKNSTYMSFYFPKEDADKLVRELNIRYNKFVEE